MRFVKLDENNIVVGIRNGKDLVDGEIQSDIGKLEQIMKEDGTFIDIDAPIEEVTPQPTLEDKVNYLYYKSMGVI